MVEKFNIGDQVRKNGKTGVGKITSTCMGTGGSIKYLWVKWPWERFSQTINPCEVHKVTKGHQKGVKGVTSLSQQKWDLRRFMATKGVFRLLCLNLLFPLVILGFIITSNFTYVIVTLKGEKKGMMWDFYENYRKELIETLD